MSKSGFNKGAISITEEPFSDWASQLAKVNAGLKERVSAGIDQVMANVETDLQAVMRDHPSWPNDLADVTQIHAASGEYEILVADERAAGLEFGRDPEASPAALIAPFASMREDSLGAEIEQAVQKALKL